MPQTIRSALIGLCDRAYDEPTAPILDRLGPATHLLAFEGDTPVSHACWVERQLQAGDARLMRTAYVELVATEPSRQGRGHASAALRQVIEQVASTFEIAALSPSDPAFYARLGWELWLGPLSARTATGLALDPSETAMIHRLPRTPILDLTAPLSIEWREGEVW